MKLYPAKIIPYCIAAVILLTGMLGHAAVSVVTSATITTNAAPAAASLTIPSFNMGAGNCLVVMVSGKVGTTFAVSGVTFGGSALDGTTGNKSVVQGANGAAIFWAINPTTRSGDVVVSFSSSSLSGGGVTVLSLSGLGSGGGSGETASATATTKTTLSLTYTGTAGGMAIFSGSDSAGTTPTLGGTPTLTATLRNNYNCSIGQGYGATATLGSYTTTYAPTGTTVSRESAAAVAFDPGYVVTYDGNGSTGGTVPNNAGYASGATVTVANNTGTLTKTGYTFAGWNTQSDGNGTTYTAGSGTFTISADTTLYAKWTAASATITTSGSLSTFSTTYGTPSPNQSFMVSGANISGGILVTVPAGFEVSQSSGSGYGSSTTVSGSGTISATTIYVRLAAATVAGTYSGNVACTSTGATAQDVAIPSSSVGNATLTITSPTASNKTFDGTATATVGGTLSASQNGDSLTLTGSFPSSAPGTGLTVTFGVTGTHSSSYTVTQPSPAVSANIAGTSITLNSADASGTSSFNGSTNWNIVAVPVAGNTYSAAFVLRTPASGSFSFAGDSLTIQTGGQLAVKSANGTTQTANNLILTGGSISESTGSGVTPILAGNITASANATISALRSGTTSDTLDITAPISGGSGVTLTIGGTTTGTVRFSGANTFSGTVTVNGTDYSSTAGVLQLNNLNAVQSSTLNLATSMSGVAGLTFNSAANTGTFNIGTLAGANVATTFALKDTASAAVAISVGANNASTTYAGIITDSGSLTKVGNGTLTLSGANTYSGNTTINGGTLQVDGASGAINSSSGITINGSGAKYLHAASTASTRTITQTLGTVDGTGTLGTVNVANNSANVVQNGNGGTGQLTIGTLTFNGAATINLAQSGTAGTSGVNVTGALTTTPGSGTVTVNATIAGGTWSSGTTYNLVHSASGSLNVSDFTKGTIAGLTGRQSASLVQVDANTIGLQISGDAPKWTGLDSANWVVGSTGASGNWQLITGSTATDYIPGDSVTFDDSATVAHNAVNISAANVSPTATIFNNSSVSYTVGGSFGIAAGTLIVNGGGTVNLNTPNTYSGSTTISSSSTLNLGGSLGSTAISVGSGSALSETAGGVIGGSASLASSGSTTLAGANTYSGGTTLSAGQLNINNGGDATHSAIGTGALTISGGTIDNTSSGDVSLSPAITQNWNSDFTYAGSVHNLNLGTGAVTLAANRQVTVSTNTLTVGGAIGGSYSLTKAGNGTLTLSGVNTYSGKTIVNVGTVNVSADSGLGTAPGSLVADQLTLNGGTLSVPTGFTMSNKRGITLGASGGTIDVAGGQTLTYSVLLNGPGSLTKNGAGTLDLSYSSADSTFNGLILNNGTIAINKSNIGAGSGTVTINGGGIRTDSATVRSPGNPVVLNGDVTLGASGTTNLNFTGNWTITNSSHIVTVDTITATIAAIGEDAGGRGLTKAGTGKLVLATANTYSGNTTISSGTLLVNGSIGSGAVAVNADAALGGSGTISGAVTVDASGTLRPGLGGTDTTTLTIGGALTLSGTNLFALNRANAQNASKVAGSVSVSGGVLTVTNVGSALVDGDSFTLYTVAPSGTFAATNLPAISETGTNWWTINNYQTLTYNVWPTPTSPTVHHTKGLGVKIPLADLVSGATNSKAISVTSLGSPGVSGASVVSNSAFILYTPGTADANDSFTYTLNDGRGGSASGTVSVIADTGNVFGQTSPQLTAVNGEIQVKFFGVPGFTYVVQSSTNLTDWADISTNSSTTGSPAFTVTNQPGADQAYYRLKY